MGVFGQYWIGGQLSVGGAGELFNCNFILNECVLESADIRK